MVTVAIVAVVAAAAIGAYGQVEQGREAKSAANYNAKVLEQQAWMMQKAAEAESQDRRRRQDLALGSQRAKYGGSGVLISEGTPLLVQMQAEEQAALDVARIRHRGEVGAWGLLADARAQRRLGAHAQRQSYLAATGTLLGGVGQGAGIYAGSRPATSA